MNKTQKILAIAGLWLIGIFVYAAPSVRFERSILPESNNTYDLGSATSTFRQGHIRYASSTAISISGTGLATSTIYADNLLNATSSIANGLTIGVLNVSTTTATSTFRGISLLGGGFRIATLDCSGLSNGGSLTTDANGNVGCSADDGGGGASAVGADGQIQFVTSGSLNASDNLFWNNTVGFLGIASSTAPSIAASAPQLAIEMGTSTFPFWIGDKGTSTPTFAVFGNNRVGLGTTTPIELLSIQGNTLASGTTTSGALVATSSLFTTTLYNNAEKSLTIRTHNSNQNSNILIISGSAVSGNTAGGAIDIQTGNGFGSSGGGDFTYTAGTGGDTGVGGLIAFNGGFGGATSGAGGRVDFTGGDAQAGNSNGGDLNFAPGLATGSGVNGASLFTRGRVGIGTSTPGTLLSVGTGGNWSSTGLFSYSPLFIPNFTATSTTATSTISAAATTGGLEINGGALRITGFTGTSSISGGLSVDTLQVKSTSATSTFGNGIDLLGGCYRKLGACLTDVSSSLTGILEEAGGVVSTVTVGSSLDYTGTTLSVGTVSIGDGGTNATSQTTNGVNYFDGTSITSGTGLTFTGTNFGVSTTTPGSLLSIGSVGNFNIGTSTLFQGLKVSTIEATSTTATSTFRGLSILGGGFRIANLDCSGFTSGGALTTDSGGNINCSADDGGTTAPQGANGNIQFATSGAFNSSGQLTWTNSNGRLGIATTTPSFMLSIGATTTPAIGFYASSTAVVKENRHPADVATQDINWNVSNQHQLTLTGNRTLTFTGGEDGGVYRLVLCQDGTGNRIPTWPTSVNWINGSTTPTLSTRANACDILSLIRTRATGTPVFMGSSILD